VSGSERSPEFLESVAFCRLASPAVPDYTTCLPIIGLLANELNRFNTGVF
jgi:hypothetical protein